MHSSGFSDTDDAPRVIFVSSPGQAGTRRKIRSHTRSTFGERAVQFRTDRARKRVPHFLTALGLPVVFKVTRYHLRIRGKSRGPSAQMATPDLLPIRWFQNLTRSNAPYVTSMMFSFGWAVYLRIYHRDSSSSRFGPISLAPLSLRCVGGKNLDKITAVSSGDARG